MALTFPDEAYHNKDKLKKAVISEDNDFYENNVSLSDSYNQGGLKANKGYSSRIETSSSGSNVNMPTYNCQFCEGSVRVVQSIAEYDDGGFSYLGYPVSSYLHENKDEYCDGYVAWATAYNLRFKNMCFEQCNSCYNTCVNGCFNSGCVSGCTSCDEACYSSCNTDCQTSCATGCTTLCTSCASCTGGCTSCASCTGCASGST